MIDIIPGDEKHAQRQLEAGVVEISRQMSSWKDLVVEPSRRVSLKGLNRTKDTRVFILV